MMTFYETLLTSLVGGTLGGLIGLLGERHKFFFSEKLEGAKFLFSEKLEGAKFINALKIAAIDKRLQAHQEAFDLWSKLSGNLFADDNQQQALQAECAAWWFKNCLYLEPQAREAFRVAYASVRDHKLVVSTAPRNDEGAKQINKSFMNVYGAGDIIVNAVSLPGLSKDAEAYLEKRAKENAPPQQA